MISHEQPVYLLFRFFSLVKQDPKTLEVPLLREPSRRVPVSWLRLTAEAPKSDSLTAPKNRIRERAVSLGFDTH